MDAMSNKVLLVIICIAGCWNLDALAMGSRLWDDSQAVATIEQLLTSEQESSALSRAATEQYINNPSIVQEVNATPAFRATWGYSRLHDQQLFKHPKHYCFSRELDCRVSYLRERYGDNLLDRDLFADLSVRAAQIWSALLSCARDSAVEARAHYRTQQYCADPVQQAEIATQLQKLRQSIVAAAQTSLVMDAYGVFTVEGIHPLITQIVVEELFFENLEVNDWKADPEVGGATIRNAFYVKEVIAAIYNENTYATTAEMRESILKHQGTPVYQKIRRILFYSHYLDLISQSNCNAWGLWPQTLNIALPYFNAPGPSPFPYWHDSSRFYRIEEKLAHTSNRKNYDTSSTAYNYNAAKVFALMNHKTP
jgi:hypothetical protein